MEDLFTNRAPTPEQAERLDEITAAMLACAAVLEDLPDSRFKSLAFTKLEECSMWAKKATVFTVGPLSWSPDYRADSLPRSGVEQPGSSPGS